MADTKQPASPRPGNSKKRKPTARRPGAPVYAFSFRWLLIGLVFVLVGGAVVGGLYLYRMRNLTGNVLTTAKFLLKEADELIKEADSGKGKGKTDDEVRLLRLEALKKKEQAANLLLDYQRRKSDDVEVAIQLFDTLEGMQTDGPMTPVRRNQIIGAAQKVLGLVTDKDSVPYRQRILELEWENGNLNNVRTRAREVLIRTDKTGRDS